MILTSFAQNEGDLSSNVAEFPDQSFPKISKADYYSLRKQFFIVSVLNGLPQSYNESQRKELIRKLRPEIKGLYFWIQLDGQVTNGGFSQFFDNSFEATIPESRNFLISVGDTIGFEILDRAIAWNNNFNNKEMLFDSELSRIDQAYFAHSPTSYKLIENHIRSNSHLYVRDESGEIFPTFFSGKISSIDSSTKERIEFDVLDNQIHGKLRRFTPTGKLSEELTYEKGIQLGTQRFYNELGSLDQQKEIHQNPFYTEISSYYSNGQLMYKTQIDSLGKAIGERKQWYENGNLEYAYVLDANGNHTAVYFEYYPDGKKRLEIDRRGKDPRYINYWDSTGNQLLENGTGYYFLESTFEPSSSYRYEYQFKEYLEDGEQREYKNGNLHRSREMENGEPSGYFREFYSNGKLKEEYLIREGKVVNSQKNPLFDHPILKVKFETQQNEPILIQRGYPIPDTDPQLLNEDESGKEISFPLELFELYGWEKVFFASYLLHIGETGKVVGFDFMLADSGYTSSAIEAIFPKLIFAPGTKKGISTTSYMLLRAEISLEESK